MKTSYLFAQLKSMKKQDLTHLTPFSQNLVNFLNQITENNEVYDEINVGISPLLTARIMT